MRLEQIHDEWDKDALIDRTDLSEASEVIPKLHAKYLRIYSQEKMKYVQLLTEMKKLRLAKHDHYVNGSSKENQEKGWTLPPRGKVIKTDAPMYIEADQHIADLQLQIDLFETKIYTLEAILKQINNRTFIIRNIIERDRYTGGD